jgi:hypothetical protein
MQLNAQQSGKRGIVVKAKVQVFFVHEAKTYREKAGVRIKVIETGAGLSRATIGRIEGGEGVLRTTAHAYLKALKLAAPDYPYQDAFSYPENSRGNNIVKLDPSKLGS